MQKWFVVAVLFAAVGCGSDPEAAVDAGRSLPEGWRTTLEDAPQGLLLSVWGRAADDVYIAGGHDDRAAIAHWDGAALTWLDNPGARRAWWVFGFDDPPSTYVVGEDGMGLRRQGDGPWMEWRTGVSGATLFGVWGTSPDDLWVVGGDVVEGPPVLRHWDGAAWNDAALPDFGDKVPKALFKVWGTASDRVFAAGDRGVMLRYDGAGWQRMPAPDVDAVLTVHGGPAGVWAVGGRASGRVLRLEGDAWIEEEPPPPVPGLAGVFAAGDGAVLVAGASGRIFERDPSGAWSAAPPLTRDMLHGVWVAPNGERWAVGGNLLSPRGDHHGVVLRAGGRPVAGRPPLEGDATVPPPDTGASPPDAAASCFPGAIRGAGPHRLYLQGRQGDPDGLGRYPLLEDEGEIVHGEHYLLGEGAFAEWRVPVCADLGPEIRFYIPNNDDPGSEARHQLFRDRGGVSTLLAETIDTQAGDSGYNPFDVTEARRDVELRAGDELLLRTTNLNDVMYSVMIFRPPSEYMSYLDIELLADGPPVADGPAETGPEVPCTRPLEIGSGEERFEPLDDGGPVPLVVGPQGSFMLFFGLRADGLAPGDADDPLAAGNPLVQMRATLGGRLVGHLQQRVGLRDGTAAGLILTVDPDMRAADMLGVEVDIAAQVTDHAGVRACGQRAVTPARLEP